MSASEQIRDLVQAKLAGRKIDVVGFIDQLLDLSQEVGAIRCSLAAEDSLRFELPGLDSCEVKLDAGRGKLRMLCARLHVLLKETSGPKASPYGGEGAIIPNDGRGWTTRFKNTPAEQEFTIVPVKDRLAVGGT